MTENTEFQQKFVNYAITHMNEDHRPDMRDMIKAFLKEDWVTDAEMLDFDREQIKLKGFGEKGEEKIFMLPYDAPIDKAQELRPKLVQMVRQAREILQKDV
ncbi:MAG: DUF2470 domain-containing protein [Saprospiraceae bacterium]|nr:DUF2470 domain-containing protein [Saprospiraceae bacterium]